MKEQGLYRVAFGLALFTIAYNVAEGVISMIFGLSDESLALFGFGVDSFVEVISGVGIAHMVYRIWKFPAKEKSQFEQTALRITGVAFYLLTFGLVISAFSNILRGHKPETTFWGVVIAGVSILTMGFLVFAKKKVGRLLHSEAILADANCTLVCMYMSFVLLISSGLYEIWGISYVDSLGALGLAFFSWKEGRESFAKARGESCECGHE
ncbi:MAG: cation transporter [Brevinematales bacterium]|nr:cation transporter [Brevinematales bacterium]